MIQTLFLILKIKFISVSKESKKIMEVEVFLNLVLVVKHLEPLTTQ